MNKDQPSSVWLIEFRHRGRKNGKWSDWTTNDNPLSPQTAYIEFPADRIRVEEKYQRRAVEYVRLEPQE